MVNIGDSYINGKPVEAWNVLETETKQKLTNLFFAGLLFWISITLMLPTLPTYIQSMGGTTKQVGMVMSCFAIGLIASRTWLGKVADRRSRKLVILIGAFVAAVAPVGYLLVHSIVGLGYIRAFHGISIAAFTIGYSALVVDLAPLQHRGTLIGYMNLAVPIGMSIGPALGGFLQQSGKQFIPNGTGYEILFLISIICGVLALLLASQIKESSLPGKTSNNSADAQVIQRDFWQLTQDPGLNRTDDCVNAYWFSIWYFSRLLTFVYHRATARLQHWLFLHCSGDRLFFSTAIHRASKRSLWTGFIYQWKSRLLYHFNDFTYPGRNLQNIYLVSDRRRCGCGCSDSFGFSFN